MSSNHVLRLKLTDSDGFVLINVTSIGPLSLDLRLLATEGSSPFVVRLKHSRIAEYHSKKSPVSLDDWETILRATLLQERLEGPSRVILEDVEVSATLVDDGLAIIFRKNLSGITQRIGRIPIRKDENQEIDTIGWVATAATRSEVLEKEVVDLLRRFNEQNDIIQKLNQQLEDLIRTKQRHENLLLEKLMAVLNAKKRKTRDQQRLLATSKVDPSKATQIQSIRMSSPSTSRPLKRKSNKSETASLSDDGGFEKMDVEEEADGLDRRTPEKSDVDETSDEADFNATDQPVEKIEEFSVAGRDDEEETDDDDDEL